MSSLRLRDFPLINLSKIKFFKHNSCLTRDLFTECFLKRGTNVKLIPTLECTYFISQEYVKPDINGDLNYLFKAVSITAFGWNENYDFIRGSCCEIINSNKDH